MNCFRFAERPRHRNRARATLMFAIEIAVLLGSSALCRAQNGGRDENELMQDAAQSMVAGNLQQAETDLKSVLHTNPREYRALNLLGMIRAQQQRNAEAEKIFKSVVQLRPNFAGAHVTSGPDHEQPRGIRAAVDRSERTGVCHADEYHRARAVRPPAGSGPTAPPPSPRPRRPHRPATRPGGHAGT